LFGWYSRKWSHPVVEARKISSQTSSRTLPLRANGFHRAPIVDGEILALDESGRVSFNLLQHHRSKAQALLFYVFDVLAYRDRSLLNEPLKRRRETLSEIFKGVKAAPIAVSESLNASPDELVRVAKEFGFEGIVGKRKNSVYESGKRTGAWVKYKVNRGQEFVIGGYTPGNPLDALIVGYYEEGKLLYAAKVRNGFVPQVRRDVARRFRGLEADACPFANLPEKKRTQWALTKEEMKNCVWLKPELVAQIEFTERTPDGHLRHSKFVGLREVKEARDVVRDSQKNCGELEMSCLKVYRGRVNLVTTSFLVYS